MLILGHHLLRLDEADVHTFVPQQYSIERPSVNWWGEKPTPPHALDLMVGDRRSDMGAGWAFGARLFETPKPSGFDWSATDCTMTVTSAMTFNRR